MKKMIMKGKTKREGRCAEKSSRWKKLSSRKRCGPGPHRRKRGRGAKKEKEKEKRRRGGRRAPAFGGDDYPVTIIKGQANKRPRDRQNGHCVAFFLLN